MRSERLNEIFEESIREYYRLNDIYHPIPNPYKQTSLEGLLFRKNWIDNRQWNLEDLIRDRKTPPQKGIQLKWEIDECNQERTDTVEIMDDIFFQEFQEVVPQEGAFLNTETPAWAIDRLSILHIKLYHMRQKVNETDEPRLLAKSKEKLQVLQFQHKDLCMAIDQLFDNIKGGHCVIRTYKQMKMYNDPDYNPYLSQEK